MLKKLIDATKSEGPILPNKFTIAMGKLIQEARVEAKMSQADLAEDAYLKQSSISRIEVGTRAVSAEEILYLSIALNKPIDYFFPEEFTDEYDADELSLREKELISIIRKLGPEELTRLLLQARLLAEYGNY